MALVAGDAHGCQLMSWTPSRTWYAETFGCNRDVRSMLSESCVCCISLHHRIVGNSLLPTHRPVMK